MDLRPGQKAEDGIRDVLGSRGLGDVYKRQDINSIYKEIIEKNIKDGLLVVQENKMFLTAKGMELSNSVMSDFILDKS